MKTVCRWMLMWCCGTSYGVARVYSQQCGYVLTDAETAKANMRAMFNVLRTSALEAEGGHKGRLVDRY